MVSRDFLGPTYSMKQHWNNFKKVRKAKRSPLCIKQKNHGGEMLPETFAIVVWNIFKRNGGEVFDRDLNDLSERSDLLCLQEVLSHDDLHLSKKINELNYNYSISYQRPDDFYEGILTASRYFVDESCYSLLSIATEPVTNTHKSSVISLMRLASGNEVLVINIHMLLFKRRSIFKKELAQVLRLCQRYKRLPAIFCGDFNTFTSVQLKLLDYTLQVEGFSRCEPAHEPRGKQFLDHIYIRGLECIEMDIVDTISSSDHYPLICKLKEVI